MIYALLAIATLLTSLISGVLSMAGGMILMGVFGLFLSVPVAMVLHGISQAFSNGTRVWLYRRHIKWSLLAYYGVGALIVLGVFLVFTIVPNIAVVFILIGSFPFISYLLPKDTNLDMSKPPVSFLCGLLVTTAQMLAGVSGPVLDLFYVKSSLTKEQILGTKAVTQTLGHVLKLGYYATVMVAVDVTLPVWVYPVVIGAAILGNYLASFIVDRISDAQFKRIGNVVIQVIGVILILKGTAELLQL